MASSTSHISICGGGIGGLTLALVISKYGRHPVEIFEAGPIITTIGAGITFYARTLDIMKELGLYDDIVKMAVKPPLENTGLFYRKSDQRDGYHWFTRNVPNGQLTLHRKDLVDLLFRQISDTCKIHTSKKLEFYKVDPETGKTTLHFTDGSTAITDVLVGADGIRSATRKTMYKNLASLARDDVSRERLLECVDAIWTGILAYRSLIPIEKLAREYPEVEALMDLTLHLGRDKHFVTYPISQGRLIYVIIYIHDRDAYGTTFDRRWVQDVSEKEILDQFDDWEDRARALVKCIERPSRWALHSTRALPHYVDDKVVLLGDAAHAMEPHFGAGAGQAMEDAFVLGRLLTHELTNQGNIADALKVYEDIRLPFANSIVQRSHDIGRYCGLHYSSADGRDSLQGIPAELDRIRTSIEDAWKWQTEPAWTWGDAEQCWRAKCKNPCDVL